MILSPADRREIRGVLAQHWTHPNGLGAVQKHLAMPTMLPYSIYMRCTLRRETESKMKIEQNVPAEIANAAMRGDYNTSDGHAPSEVFVDGDGNVAVYFLPAKQGEGHIAWTTKVA